MVRQVYTEQLDKLTVNFAKVLTNPVPVALTLYIFSSLYFTQGVAIDYRICKRTFLAFCYRVAGGKVEEDAGENL